MNLLIAMLEISGMPHCLMIESLSLLKDESLDGGCSTAKLETNPP